MFADISESCCCQSIDMVLVAQHGSSACSSLSEAGPLSPPWNDNTAGSEVLMDVYVQLYMTCPKTVIR